jgi:hypothetical protein
MPYPCYIYRACLLDSLVAHILIFILKAMASPHPGAPSVNGTMSPLSNQHSDQTIVSYRPIPYEVRLDILVRAAVVSRAEAARMALVSADTYLDILPDILRNITIEDSTQAILFYRTLACWWPFGAHKDSRKQTRYRPSADMIETISFDINISGYYVALALAAIPKLKKLTLFPIHFMLIEIINRNAIEVLPTYSNTPYITALSIAYHLVMESEGLQCTSLEDQVALSNLLLHICAQPDHPWLPAIEAILIPDYFYKPFLSGMGDSLNQFFSSISQYDPNQAQPLVTTEFDARKIIQETMARVNNHINVIATDEDGNQMYCRSTNSSVPVHDTTSVENTTGLLDEQFLSRIVFSHPVPIITIEVCNTAVVFRIFHLTNFLVILEGSRR